MNLRKKENRKEKKKHKKKNKLPPIKLCPGCMKPTLVRAIGGWMNTETYQCRECEYSGALYIEYDPQETGEKLVDLENLKEEFSDDVDPDTEIDLNEELTKNREEMKNKTEPTE
jgi:hypothetical protein